MVRVITFFIAGRNDDAYKRSERLAKPLPVPDEFLNNRKRSDKHKAPDAEDNSNNKKPLESLVECAEQGKRNGIEPCPPPVRGTGGITSALSGP